MVFKCKRTNNGPTILAVAICAPHEHFYNQELWNKTWVCYTENRLIEVDERPYYDDLTKYEVSYIRTVVDYCEIPELDNMLWDYRHKNNITDM